MAILESAHGLEDHGLNPRGRVFRNPTTALLYTHALLRSEATLGGIGGVLLGAPLRAARIRVAPDLVDVPGAGVRIPFAFGEPAEPGELGRHQIGLFEAAGLRAFRMERHAAAWRRAELVGEPRADALLALGFDVPRPDSLLYATGGSFTFELPPRLVSGVSSSARRSRR